MISFEDNQTDTTPEQVAATKQRLTEAILLCVSDVSHDTEGWSSVLFDTRRIARQEWPSDYPEVCDVSGLETLTTEDLRDAITEGLVYQPSGEPRRATRLAPWTELDSGEIGERYLLAGNTGVDVISRYPIDGQGQPDTTAKPQALRVVVGDR